MCFGRARRYLSIPLASTKMAKSQAEWAFQDDRTGLGKAVKQLGGGGGAGQCGTQTSKGLISECECMCVGVGVSIWYLADMSKLK